MRDSDHEGEIQSAVSLAERIVRPFGYGVKDIPELLKPADLDTRMTEGSRLHATRAYEWDKPRFRAGANEGASKGHRKATESDDIIRRYSGKHNILAWTKAERLLRAAVAKWSTFFPPPNQQHTRSLDGRDSFELRVHSTRVIQAISAAYALPTTITQADLEYSAWRRRHEELALVRHQRPFKEIELDLPAELRRQIIAHLLETELRAVSISEVYLRQKHHLTLQHFQPEIDYAILRDVERLAKTEQMQAVHFGHTPKKPAKVLATATERRAEVQKLLSNMATKVLPDREIARQVGVSPQTVGNIRRRMGR